MWKSQKITRTVSERLLLKAFRNILLRLKKPNQKREKRYLVQRVRDRKKKTRVDPPSVQQKSGSRKSRRLHTESKIQDGEIDFGSDSDEEGFSLPKRKDNSSSSSSSAPKKQSPPKNKKSDPDDCDATQESEEQKEGEEEEEYEEGSDEDDEGN